jgi:hypothetical protein
LIIKYFMIKDIPILLIRGVFLKKQYTSYHIRILM